ncbi:DUF397 domain-containing protein [Saccharothrix deserti]
MGVRDSTNADGPRLVFAARGWKTFLAQVSSG